MVLTALTITLALVLQGQGATDTATPSKPKRPSAATVAADRAANEVVELRKTVETLTEQVKLLRSDLAAREEADAETLDSMRLLLVEERIARLKSELEDARARRRNGQARVDEFTERLRNIGPDMIMAGGIDREESERAVRAALGRALADAQNEVQQAEADISSLEREIATSDQWAAPLRKRVRTAAERHAAEAEQHADQDDDSQPQ